MAGSLDTRSARVNLVCWRLSSRPKPDYCGSACGSGNVTTSSPAVVQIPGNVFTCGHTRPLSWQRSCALEWEWCHGILNVRQWRFTAIACFRKHQHQMTYSYSCVPQNIMTRTNIFICKKKLLLLIKHLRVDCCFLAANFPSGKACHDRTNNRF